MLVPKFAFRFALVGCSAAALADNSHAQVLVHQVTGISAGDHLGFAVSSLGDVNGDSIPDFIAGAPGDFLNGTQPGKAFVYSGFDGSLVYGVSGQTASDGFGMSLAALGDVNGDSRPDFIVGAPYSDVTGSDAGSAFVFSGATGSLVHAIHGLLPGDAFGWSVSRAGFSFGVDATPDFVVGAPLADTPLHDAGRATVYSGVSGTVLKTYEGTASLDQLGYAIAFLDLASGTPAERLVLSAPFALTGAGTRGGTVSLFFATSSLPDRVFGASATDTLFGQRIAVLQHEVFGSPPRLCIQYLSNGNPILILVLANTGQVLCDDSFPGLGSIASSSDINGEDFDDIVVGQSQSARVLGGLGCLGSFPLATVSGDASFGFAVGGAGDLNGDSKGEFLVGSPGYGVAQDGRGRVSVYSAGFPPPVPYCVAKQNSLGCTPSVASTGVPSVSIANNFFVSASNVLNHRAGMLVWSLYQTTLPFAGGTLCIGPLVQRTPLQSAGGNLGVDDCSGTYAFHFSHAYMNAASWFPGLTVHAQYYSRDGGFLPPNNVGLTNGMKFTVIP